MVREAESVVKMGPVGVLEIGPEKDTEDRNGFRGRLADLRIYRRVLNETELRYLAVDHRVSHMVSVAVKQRPKELVQKIREHYLTYVAPQETKTAWADLKALRERKAYLEDVIPNTMVMSEMDKPRDTFAAGAWGLSQSRGEGDAECAGRAAAAGGEREGGRLALARWLVDPSHPLTARVTAVNRYWQNYFGIGLVKSSENFGTQGDMPSHPELLDWMATEFSENGLGCEGDAADDCHVGDVPAIVQDDARDGGARSGEPVAVAHVAVPDAGRNRARQRTGGERIVEPEGGRAEHISVPTGRDLGRDFARRNLLRAGVQRERGRGSVSPRDVLVLEAHGAADVAFHLRCAGPREVRGTAFGVANTPLQALVLLNDPAYVEAARVLAQNILNEAGSDTAKRLTLGFRKVTGRVPRSAGVEGSDGPGRQADGALCAGRQGSVGAGGDRRLAGG